MAGTFVEFSGGISGAGFGITKEGAGTLRLSGTNSYTGATTVSTGTLVVNGNISTSVSLTVEAGATLGGDGTLGAATISGSLAPGNSIGTLTATGDVTWNSNNAWVFELGIPAVDLAAASLGNDNDQLLIAASGDFLKDSGTSALYLNVIPEPSAAVLLGLGGSLILLRRRVRSWAENCQT